ncbi:MAG: FG-GAP-like repeat-containing protein [Planctomycetota bacterium]|nr:FG-GAP-like repeat-containing protein [Planctomycetota bacterium]
MVLSPWLARFRRSLKRHTRSARRPSSPRAVDRPANQFSRRIEVVEGRTLLTTLVINVDEVADVINGNGQTSLREAVIQANSATEDEVIINLPANTTFTLGIAAAGADDATTGDLNITNSTSEILIQGQPGSIIDFRDTGGGISARVFEIAISAHRVELENLTLRGTATGAAGGAILNRSFLEMNSVLVELSSSDTGGGGLQNSGTGNATIINSTFDQNQATGSGDGGAIFNTGQLTVAATAFTGNSGDDGGAISAGANSNTFIETSLFSGNMSAGEGGAIRVGGGNAFLNLSFSQLTGNMAGTNGGGLVAFSSGANVFIDSSTIDGNTASGTGGGLQVGDQVSIVNSTIFGNTSSSGVAGGGGIRVQPTGRLDLTSATLAGNIAASRSGGALSVDSGGVVTASSSIFADSTDGVSPITDVDGSVTSFGTSIVESGGGAAGFDTVSGDQFQDPLLDPGGLRDNGGPTPTVALQAIALGFGSNSPAIDAAGSHAEDDQRLVPRLAGSADIGAFEVDPQVYFVNTTADTPDADSMDNLPIDGSGNVSLRSAIMALNNFEGGNGVIILPPGQFTLTQTSGGSADSNATNDLDISASNVRIIGTGSLSTRIDASGLAGDGVDGGGNDRVFEIFGTGTSITGVTIANGNAGMLDGGGIMVESGSLHLTDSSLEDNSAANGGGLATGISSVDSLTLDGVTVFENTATVNGGGVALLSFFTQPPTIRNSNISRNTAAANGGGVVASASLEITGTSLIRNTSGIDGGGVAFDGISGGTLNVTDSTVSANISGGFGGGIASSGPTAIMDSAVTLNSATLSGGGVAATAGTLRIAGTTISGNTATVSGGGVAVGVPPGMGPVFTTPADAEIRFSDISFNSAGASGGGVANSAGDLLLFASSVTNNVATTGGGGLANTEFGRSEIVSSTFSGNTAGAGGFGGGLLNESGSLDVTNATVTLNTAASGGGIASRNNANTTVQKSIIAQNILSGGGMGVDAFADTVITSGGNNVVGVGEVGFVNGLDGDLTGTAVTPLDARLAPLADNGGFTQTHALLTSGPASPAIDAGSNSNLDMNDAEFDVDQRGAERILGVSVDAGAYESGSNAIFVTTTQDVVDGGDGVISLREAINMANAAPDADRIVLPAGRYELTLFGQNEDGNMSGDLDITEEVTIVGYGMGVTVVDGVASDRLFEVHSTVATFLDMTIQNGRVTSASGGGIFAQFSTTTLERVEVADNVADGGNGGGVGAFNPVAATLNVRDSVFRNNSASGGGGAINTDQDTLNVFNTTFDNNTALSTDGGAIRIFGANALIVGSQFTSNFASGGRGGAVFIEKDFGNTVTIDASRFAENVAASGGGVSIRNETVVITGSEFSTFDDGARFLGGNQATMGDGGAIENTGGNLTVQSTRIASNVSNSFGGGIVNAGSGAVLVLEDSVLENNSASFGGGGLYADQAATVRRSTFSSNFASDGGGINNGGTLLLVNSTLSGNIATNQGGGLLTAFSGTSTIEHSTITANQSSMGGGGIQNSGSTVSLKNTIVAGNFDSLGNADLQGQPFTSNGNNLIGDVDGASVVPGSNDILGGDSQTATVSTASFATPVQIDTASAHTLQTGDLVRIVGVLGNNAANGTFRVTVIDADSFTLADLNGFSISGTGPGSDGEVFRLADAQIGPLLNNTAPNEFVEGGQELTLGGGVSPDTIQPIAPVVPFTHRPLVGSPVIDAGDATEIESFDNRGTGFPRNVDGDNSGGAAPDIGALEVYLTSVTGRKFDDTNGNGVQDMGETGLGGITVYADLNENGVLDSGDRLTTTDFDGTYTLDLVPPGTTIIGEFVPIPFSEIPGFPLPGSRQTFPSGLVTASQSMNLGAGMLSDPEGVTTADVDGNGRLDVIFVQSAANQITVLRQRLDGTIVRNDYGVTGAPREVVAADFNGDGFLDFATLTDAPNVTLFRNQGNGTFVTSSTTSLGTSALNLVAGDFSGDGLLDIALVNPPTGSVTILTGDGMGGLNGTPFATPSVGGNPQDLVAADFDRDGRLDLATVDRLDNQVTVLLNQGGGAFSSSVIPLTVGSDPRDIDAGDIDRDGLVDLVVSRPGDGVDDVAVIFNRGLPSGFNVVSAGALPNVNDVRLVDLNGDGFLDIAATESISVSSLSLFQFDPATRTFLAPVVIDGGNVPRALTVGDLNSDGRLDLITTSANDDVVVANLNLSGSQVANNVTGVVTTGIDFGNQLLGSVSGTKFSDRNSNGTRDGFFDDFASGTPDRLWQNEVGNWNVVSGEYAASSPGNSPLTYNSLPFELTDFEVTFDVNNVNDGGVFLRSTAFDPAEPSGVLLVTGSPTTSGTGLYWHIVTNGVEGPALQVTAGLFQAGDDISIRVTVVGDTYSAYVNGSEVPDTVLTTSMFNQGRFALYSNSSQTIDNVNLPENGLAGVGLFLDLNDNGRHDSFEPVTFSQTDDPTTFGFDETGRYFFNNVIPGPARVYEFVPPGSEQTTPNGLALTVPTELGTVGDNAVDSLIADLDGDGRNDLVVLSAEAAGNGNLRVFGGTGTQYVHLVGGPIAVGMSPEAVAPGDLDGDGDLDLAVSNSGSDTIQLFENTGGLTFVLRATLNVSAGDMPGDLQLSDLNGDGLADVIVANSNSPAGVRGISVFTNSNSSPGAGNYLFTGPVNLNTGGQTIGLVVADLDGDGDGDIAAAVNDTSEVRVFENLAGAFLPRATISTGSAPLAIDALRFNDDNRVDLVISRDATLVGSGVEVFSGIGLFQYGPAQGLPLSAAPDSLAVIDINNDGLDDLVFTSPATGEIGVLTNTEFGFVPDAIIAVSPMITGISTGDLDGDGLIDFVGVTETLGASVQALFNRLGSFPVEVLSGGMAIADFGNIDLGSISGTVFQDLDNNGTLDMDESGLSGFTVFVDENENGQLDAGEPSSISDLDGQFVISNVRPLVQNRLTVVPQAGFVSTFQLGTPVSVAVDGGARGENIGDIVTTGDLNGDGRDEIISANETVDSVSIVSFDEDGISSRVDLAVGDTPLVVRVADLNADGNLDLITANFGSGNVSVLIGTGNGSFAPSVQFAAGPNPQSLAVADFDGNGTLDVAVSSATSGNLQMLFGNGMGNLSDPTVVSVAGVSRGEDLEFGDFDGDGDVDLAVVHAIQDRVSILLNTGNGTFGAAASVGVGSFPLGMASGDLDKDGDIDLVVTNTGSGSIQVLTNNGAGVFTAGSAAALGGSPEAVVLGDVNFDGNLDVVIANQVQADVTILLGDGAGGIRQTVLSGVGSRQDGVALGDIDGDGRIDIVAETFAAGTVTVLRNLTGNQPIFLSTGQSVSGLDFGLNALPGSISGTKFRDDNENGFQDAGEPGLPGVTIYLDLDNDDVLDGGEPSTMTDANGFYEFTGLESLREYTVSELLPAGFKQIAPFHPGFAFSGDALAGGSPAGIVTGDFDGINGDDIAVTLELTGQVAILLRQAGGEFGTPTLIGVGMLPFSIVAADFDGANGIDLAVANEQDGTVLILENNGSGVFIAQENPITVQDFPLEIVVADVDGANGPDLVVVNDQNNSFQVLLNDGMGGLSAQAPVSTGVSPTSVAVADFDVDGDLDIAVTTAGDNRVTVFLQTSPGTFTGQTPIATGTDPSRIRTADVNNDGTLDLVIINQQSSDLTVVLNNSSGGMLSLGSPTYFASPVSGESLVLADFNRDGFVDVAISGEGDDQLALLLNDGLGEFGVSTVFDLDGTFPIEIAAISLNADGDVDLAITDGAFNEVLLLTSTTGSRLVRLGPGENVSDQNFANRNLNQAPVISVPASQNINEDNSLVFSSGNSNVISFTDPDEAFNPVTSQFAVTLTVDVGTLTLSETAGLDFAAPASVGDGTDDPTMVFTGSRDAINTALNGLTFTPPVNANGVATLTISVDDQGNFGVGSPLMGQNIVSINIAAVNDAPVVSGIGGGAVAYTENGAATQVTNTIAVSDVDNANLQSATVSISANYQTGQDVLSATGLPGGITANFNAGTGILTLSGSASVANYETALRQVEYSNTSEAPVTLTRTLTFRVNDGSANSNTQSRNVTVAAVNDAPVVSGIEAGSVAYTQNSPPTQVTNTIAVSDVDNANLQSATVSISANYQTGQDVLSAMGLPGGITANFNAGTGILTLSGSASVANYQTALRQVKYSNTSEAPVTLTRTLTFRVNDGSANSNTQSRDVTVAAVNDAPMLQAAQLGDITYQNNSPAVAVIPTLVIADVDSANLDSAVVRIQSGQESSDVLAATATGGIEVSFNAATGVLTLSGRSSLASYQAALRSVSYVSTSSKPSVTTRRVSFVVNDGVADSNVISRDIKVQLRPATVAGVVWADTTEDGLRDELEPRVEGVTVQVLNADDAVVSSTVTGADGSYVLSVPESLLPDSFRVRFTAPDGKHFTARNVGEEEFDAIDSDPNVLTGDVFLPDLGSGQNRQHVDAGLVNTTVSVGDAEAVNEGDGAPVSTLDFRITLNGRSPHQVTVNVRVVAGTDGQQVAQATVGMDVAPFPFQGGLLPVVFNPGQTERIVSVPIIGDTVIEPDEGVEVRLSSSTQATILDPIGFGLIRNDDFSVPTIELGDDVSVVEGQFPAEPPAEFTVRLLGGAVSEDISVSYRTVALSTLVAGAATPEIDFRSVDDVVIIPAGQTSATFRVSIIGDSNIEPDERFVVMLYDVDGGELEGVTLGMRTSGEGIIVNDDVFVPTASIGNASVRERNAPGTSVLQFPVTLDGPAATNTRIEYSILQLPGDGGATPDVDYVSFIPGPLVIPRGQTTGTISVIVRGDQIDELDEVLAVELVSVLDDNVKLGETLGVGTIINDDDGRLLASINQGRQINEGRAGQVTSFTMTVSLSGDALVPSTVFVSTLSPSAGAFNAATPGIDFLPIENRAVPIPAGRRTGTFQVDVLGDEIPEPDEFVFVSIVGVSEGIDIDPALGSATATINDDDDRPTVSIDATASTTETRPGLTSVVRIPVRLRSVSNEIVTVDFATVPSVPGVGLATDVDDPATPEREDDFQAKAGRVTFAPGQQVAFIQILVNGDSEEEPPETFAVDLTGVSPNAELNTFASRSVATIFDGNAGQPFVSLQAEATVSEPDGNGVTPVELTVTLGGRLNSNVVVGYTIPEADTPGYATAGQDYVPVGRQEIVIEAGQTTATLTVLVKGDSIPEAVEQFFVQLLDVSPPALIDQSQQQAEVTINDNDAALPTISISNASVQEGDPVGADGVPPAQDPRLNFVISLDSVPVGPVSVEVETLRTSAAAPGIANTDGPERDVFATRRILFFDPQITSQIFSVRVQPDDSFEPDELVFVRVFNPVGAVLPNQTLQGVGTVINDDFERPTVSISSTRLLEGDTPGEQVARLTVTLDADPKSGVTPDVTVGFRTTGLSATEGVDFQSLSGELEFSDGVRSQTIDIPIIGDLENETAEEFVVELFELDDTPLNADLDPSAFQGLVRIDNDDDPNVTFRIDNVRKREGTGGTTGFDFTVSRIGNSPSASTVNFATSAGTAKVGEDFAAQSGTLTFASDGSDTQIISVAVVADNRLEEEFETFFVTLSDPMNATVPPGAGQGVGTILDDDQRVFAEDANDELLEIAREIREAIDRVGNDPNNPEILALLERLNREVIERFGPSLSVIIDPVDFLLTDLGNRTVGYTETAGEVSEVPRAFYSGDGDVELVIIPAAQQGIYGLQLSGVGSGEFRAVATLVTADGFSKTILNADTLAGDVELALDFTDNTALPIQGQVVEALAALNRAPTPSSSVDEGTLAMAGELAAALGNVVSSDATITEQPGDDPFDPIYIDAIVGILRDLASELSGHMDSLPDVDSLLDPEVEAVLDAVFSSVGRQALGAPANLMLDLIDLLGVFKEEDGESGSGEKENGEATDENGADEKEEGGKENARQGNADIERFLKSRRVASTEKLQREAVLWLEERRRGDVKKTSTDDVGSVFSQPNDIPVPEDDRSVQVRGTANTGRSLKVERRADKAEEDSPDKEA